MKKRIKRIISMLMITLMLISTLSVNVMATGTDNSASDGNTVSGNDAGTGKYEAVETYVLDYMGNYTDYQYQYYSPYIFRKKLNSRSGDLVPLVYTLYNKQNGTIYPAFCIDNSVDDVKTMYYERANLEAAAYFDDTTAGRIRAILLNTFPHTNVDTIRQQTQIAELTVAEILTATQIALYECVHGDAFEVTDYYSNYQPKPSIVKYGDICEQPRITADVSGGDAANQAIEKRIESASLYFLELAPAQVQSQLVSTASFTDYSQAPVVTANEDGTYNVAVTAGVSVSMKETDAMTLSAVMGDGTYHAQTALVNGQNEVTLTIENVPANLAYTEIKLAIDGTQTADEDVFLFTAKGGASASQSFAAIDSSQLPVHAEVTIIPPMEIELLKTAKIKEQGADGQVTEKNAPLAGISFDVYKQEGQGKTLVTTITTDSTGSAFCNLTALGQTAGTFLVTEQSHPAITSPVEQVVTLPYTSADGVNVYRAELTLKNVIKEEIYTEPEVRKDVTKIDNDLDSFAIGEIHTWIIRGDIPVDIAVGKEYVITDTLDYRLSYAGDANVEVKVGLCSDITGASDVALTTDYYVVSSARGDVTVSGSDAVESVDSFVVSLTPAGMSAVAGVVANGKGNFSDYEVRVYFKAVIDEDAVPGVMIPNQAVLDYTNYVNYHFTTDSDVPQVYTCSLNIYKHDVENHNLHLNGAAFKLARLATEAEINEGMAAPLVINDVTTYVVYETFYDKAISTSEEYNAKVQKVTTGEYGTDGAAIFYGIKEGDYYLVETKAPAGYNLMTKPIAVSVRLATLNVVRDVPNSSNFELPETGGIGTLIFTVGGAILIGAAILILLLNKKKQDKEDEEE